MNSTFSTLKMNSDHCFSQFNQIERSIGHRIDQCFTQSNQKNWPVLRSIKCNELTNASLNSISSNQFSSNNLCIRTDFSLVHIIRSPDLDCIGSSQQLTRTPELNVCMYVIFWEREKEREKVSAFACACLIVCLYRCARAHQGDTTDLGSFIFASLNSTKGSKPISLHADDARLDPVFILLHELGGGTDSGAYGSKDVRDFRESDTANRRGLSAHFQLDTEEWGGSVLSLHMKAITMTLAFERKDASQSFAGLDPKRLGSALQLIGPTLWQSLPTPCSSCNVGMLKAFPPNNAGSTLRLRWATLAAFPKTIFGGVSSSKQGTCSTIMRRINLEDPAYGSTIKHLLSRWSLGCIFPHRRCSAENWWIKC